MVWQETGARTWFDDYDGAEKVFYDMSQAFRGLGKEHGSVYSVCKIGIKDGTLKMPLETMLRDAWKALRFDFPSLSVVTDEQKKKKYVAATTESVEKWANETFSIEMVLSADEIVPSLHLRTLPCLFFLPQSSEVIFHSSHWRIDALGACMVLDRLFELVSQGPADSEPCWELEHRNLPPSLEDAFGCPRVSTPAMETFAEAIRRRNFENSYPTAGLPFEGDMATLPTRSRAHAIHLTTDATRDLVAACKAHGISVTAAIHAACAEAVFERSQHTTYDYSTVVSVNLRDLLPAPYSTKAYACATYVTGITHTVSRTDDFTTRSRRLTKAYRADWNSSEYVTALRPIYRAHGEALRAVGKSGRDPSGSITVSSLGLVDKYLRIDHGLVTVERFRLGSAIMTRQMTLYIWTFRGQLTVSLDSNEAYYGKDVMAVLDSVKNCLERELKVAIEIKERT